jgi:DnaJ-class molecular chaperone
MAEAHVCPRCGGERKVHNARSGQAEDCPTCEGTGVVWREQQQEAAHADAGDGNLDLTYRQ